MIQKAVSEWVEGHRQDFFGDVLFDEPMRKHTYYRIGGPCWLMLVPKNDGDLLWISELSRATGCGIFALGSGSNLLVSDAGVASVVVKMSRLDLSIDLLSEDRVRTGASVAISTLLRLAAKEGWKNLEILTGIPGSVGGAISMNAGTSLGETKDYLRKVRFFCLRSGDFKTLEGADLKYEYRKNLFLSATDIICQGEWAVEKRQPAEVKALIDNALAKRKATQPIDFPSCGSVFKNPPASFGLSAWQVIDRLGLRGHRVGNAQFSEKHCNFIVNLGDAKAEDVRKLIQIAKKRAQSELGIALEEEVRLLGF